MLEASLATSSSTLLTSSDHTILISPHLTGGHPPLPLLSTTCRRRCCRRTPLPASSRRPPGAHTNSHIIRVSFLRQPQPLRKMGVVSLSGPAFASPFLGRKLANASSSPRTSEKFRVCSSRVPRCSYEGSVPTFPRVNVWDPYKRLGISPDASEEEVWGSRNFLLQQYVGHERSEESIEAAFEKLLMASFQHRKKTKINLKTRLKKKVDESPPWVKNLLNFVELPSTDVIFRRLFLFAFMGGWSIMNSAEGGPAFQVAVSLAACIYFLNEKTKSLGRAFVIGLAALATGWVCGSILVPMVPTVLWQPTWTLELLTSLVGYVFLFLACTFLK